MKSELRIKTPEGIAFSFLLAGPTTRFMAWLVDAMCVSVATSTVGTLFGLAGILSADLAKAIAIISYFVISIGYSITLEWFWRGQTIGKKLLRLRVVDEQGLKLQFNQIVIRNLLRYVDMLPLVYLIGGVTCLLSRRSQRLGDIAANTIVVWNPKVREPDLDQLALGKFNSLRDFPHLTARLRQRISSHEARILLQALLRREEFDPTARVELFREFTGWLRAVVEFPPEVIEGIPDEQYLRNVVDILFRTRNNASSGQASASDEKLLNDPIS